jgi:predicted O-methyltransferase YrrM
MHDQFKLAKDYTILEGLSEDPAILERVSKLKLDVLYIDGGHEERHITNDIEQYSNLVKPGGFMVIDDCCNSFHMPFGYFQGIQAVTVVVDKKLPPVTTSDEWEFVFSVVHNRVYRRK